MIDALLQPYGARTVAVTGATGYIGAALATALRPLGGRLLLVGRTPPHDPGGAAFLPADIRRPDCWETIVDRADVIFHAAGNTSVAAADDDPVESLNLTLRPLTLLAGAARARRRRPRLVYASTARVYGEVATLPASEETDLRPTTLFGLHNVFAEQCLALAAHDEIVDAVSLRLGNVYGPSPGAGSDERIVLNKIARLAVGGSDLPLYGHGTCLRDYVHIDDVVRAFLMAGARPGLAGASFNVASGSGVSVRDAFHLVATCAARRTGARARVREVPWPTGASATECRDFAADIRRAAAAFGWTPAVALRDGVDRLIAYVARESVA